MSTTTTSIALPPSCLLPLVFSTTDSLFGYLSVAVSAASASASASQSLSVCFDPSSLSYYPYSYPDCAGRQDLLVSPTTVTRVVEEEEEYDHEVMGADNDNDGSIGMAIDTNIYLVPSIYESESGAGPSSPLSPMSPGLVRCSSFCNGNRRLECVHCAHLELGCSLLTPCVSLSKQESLPLPFSDLDDVLDNDIVVVVKQPNNPAKSGFESESESKVTLPKFCLSIILKHLWDSMSDEPLYTKLSVLPYVSHYFFACVKSLNCNLKLTLTNQCCQRLMRCFTGRPQYTRSQLTILKDRVMTNNNNNSSTEQDNSNNSTTVGRWNLINSISSITLVQDGSTSCIGSVESLFVCPPFRRMIDMSLEDINTTDQSVHNLVSAIPTIKSCTVTCYLDQIPRFSTHFDRVSAHLVVQVAQKRRRVSSVVPQSLIDSFNHVARIHIRFSYSPDHSSNHSHEAAYEFVLQLIKANHASTEIHLELDIVQGNTDDEQSSSLYNDKKDKKIQTLRRTLSNRKHLLNHTISINN
ncbi:hypothetical protein DFA_03445 [Cavenderia fasciculata]|uniref:Uncharacterized protein n=1 Tax=Cavenderia fasciculata TaxID=261658 RepID=F4PHL3_CACFS|nr:uncharacterized protein DFA_03445 [Cavenderia fasciculata]EGG25197.1 hypothetical protein DFA_03445 [Cavenderia fasciculata]|eukprot:XP_004363048.1 hypothetical protein DFA_03445 [Cavenderia fasciculata]